KGVRLRITGSAKKQSGRRMTTQSGVEVGDSGDLVEFRGRVKWFNVTKGYGFVSPDSGEGDAFLQVTVLRQAGRGNGSRGARRPEGHAGHAHHQRRAVDGWSDAARRGRERAAAPGRSARRRVRRGPGEVVQRRTRLWLRLSRSHRQGRLRPRRHLAPARHRKPD